MKVISIAQVDGGVRYLALTREDARAVARDHAMLDSVRPIASCDVDARGGRRAIAATWAEMTEEAL